MKESVPFFGQNEVDKVIRQMIFEITTRSSNLDNICFLIVLKGGFYLASKICTSFPNAYYDFIQVESYRDEMNQVQDPVIKFAFDEDLLANKDVWILDDILDTGSTLKLVKSEVERCCPRTVSTAVLVRRNCKHFAHVVGFDLGNTGGFLIGCGMGLGEKHRLEPCIQFLEKVDR
jgi:hypoxanthine phosphoribosyltransferase